MIEETSICEILFPVQIDRGKILYAQGIKAGRWVFATGHMATDFKHGLSSAVTNLRLPRFGKPKNQKEGFVIFDRLREVLRAAGTSFKNVVRLDQYYPTWKAVDPYHVSRHAAFGDYVPPSTSVLQKSLLLPEAEVEVEMIAIIPEDDFCVKVMRPSNLQVPPTSGFAPLVTAGDYVFTAGYMANDAQGIPPEARVGYGQLWGGTQIKLETEYIIKKKIEPALLSADSSLKKVVKAQVYMSDVDDFPAFNEVWSKYFSADPPVTTLIPTKGFARTEGKIEINVIGIAENGKTNREIIKSDVFTGFDNQSVAIRAGDLLFISGLMAADHNGIIQGAEIDSRQPYFGSSIKMQMGYILQNADLICKKAGTSLKNVVRIQQFHTDLKDFYSAYEVWQSYLPGQFLPLSAIQVPKPLPVPECTVLLDLWVYVPPSKLVE